MLASVTLGCCRTPEALEGCSSMILLQKMSSQFLSSDTAVKEQEAIAHTRQGWSPWHFLRHPVALCYQSFPDKAMLLPIKTESLMDQGYLFYATSEQTDFGPRQHTHVDLGALVRGAVRVSFFSTFLLQQICMNVFCSTRCSLLSLQTFYSTLQQS